MNTLSKLFELRESLYKYEQELGLHELSDVERAVLEFIIHKDESTITSITKDNYFNDCSLSTIKRAVASLIDSEVITSTQSNTDKRSMTLRYNN
jgi:DNA-binding MarR family transcriptional regulator